MTKYIVAYRLNDKVIESRKFDSLLVATLHQIELAEFHILNSTVHATTDGEEEKEYGINRLSGK